MNFSENKKKIVTSIFFILLAAANYFLTLFMLDYVYGYAAAAPEIVKTISLLYVLFPMFWAVLVIQKNFSKNNNTSDKDDEFKGSGGT